MASSPEKASISFEAPPGCMALMLSIISIGCCIMMLIYLPANQKIWCVGALLFGLIVNKNISSSEVLGLLGKGAGILTKLNSLTQGDLYKQDKPDHNDNGGGKEE